MPPIHDEIMHKALSSDTRREILLKIAQKEMYLSELAESLKMKPQSVDFHLRLLEEIGIVNSKWAQGKKYYSLADKRIIDFIKQGRAIPAEMRPKAPHEIVLDMWDDMKKRFDKIDLRLDKIEHDLSKLKK